MSDNKDQHKPDEGKKDDDTLSTDGKSAHGSESGRKSPVPVLVVSDTENPSQPEDSTLVVASGSTTETAQDKVRSRSKSPRGLSTEMVLRIQAQMDRLFAVQTVQNELGDGSPVLSEVDIDCMLREVEEAHEAFTKEHQLLSTNWPTAHIEHPYNKEHIFRQELTTVAQVRRKLLNLKQVLTFNRQHIPQGSHELDAKLPDVEIPVFEGNYKDWPAFYELFKVVVLDNKRISDFGKLVRLRTYLRGPPLRLIAPLQFTAQTGPESLAQSLSLLSKRYENKRSLIQAHLDEIHSLPVVTSPSAKAFNDLSTKMMEATHALTQMEHPKGVEDCIWVDHITRRLDRETRVQWENQASTSKEYPTLETLLEFLQVRARTFENIASTQPAAKSSSQVRTPPKSQATRSATSHTVSAQPKAAGTSSTNTPRAPYVNHPCDDCDGNHFIMRCPKFVDRQVNDRMNIVVEKRLCFNCLGRHSARACRATQVCKNCGKKHHTMLHGATFAQAHSSAEGSSTSAQSSSQQSAQNQ